MEDALRRETSKRKSLERELEEQRRFATERLHSELALAREIQQGLLPESKPAWDGVRLRCFSKPAFEVGGDFYTHKASANPRALLSKYVVAVGDVSGKGVAAALLMATALSKLDGCLETRLKSTEILAHLDKALLPYAKPRRQNCALCYVEIVGVNTVRPVMRVANAGCLPPYLKRADGSVQWIEACGPPLGHGLGAKAGYPEVTELLTKGDMIILTSDGVVEAQNPAGEVFGFQRLEDTIANGPTSDAGAMLDHLKAELDDFVAGQDPHDDMTLVVVGL